LSFTVDPYTMIDQDISKSSIGSVRHEPTHNSKSLNHAVDRAIRDQNFLDSCLNLIGDLKFPAFKNNIIDHVKKLTKDADIISLFESLDGYIQFRDQHHIQEALEVNDPEKKTESQITDETAANTSSKNHDAKNNEQDKKPNQ